MARGIFYTSVIRAKAREEARKKAEINKEPVTEVQAPLKETEITLEGNSSEKTIQETKKEISKDKEDIKEEVKEDIKEEVKEEIKEEEVTEKIKTSGKKSVSKKKIKNEEDDG